MSNRSVVGPYCAQYNTKCLCGCGTWVRPGDGVWKFDGDKSFDYKEGHWPGKSQMKGITQ